MMRPDVPIGAVEAEAYTVPTDAPNGDGTLTWDSTTIVVVRARAGGRTGLGWTYAPAAAVPLVQGILAETVLGRENMAGALALGMIVVMVIVMTGYSALQRRASRWQA